MVEVDVFWTYALGASFAAAAARQIKQQEDNGRFTLLENGYFSRLLLFLGILFVPSGICLLWAFPGWETMYAAKVHKDLPAWIVTLFAVTNITQGVLGFYVAYLLIRANKLYAAHLQWVLGYFLMFFILVHGWDGTGYRRFFSGTVAQWNSQAGMSGLWMAVKWALTAKVAWTLYFFGVFMLPLLFYWLSEWLKQGYELAAIDQGKARRIGQGDLVLITLRIIFIETLGAVIGASLLIHYLGWLYGSLIFIVLAYLVLVRRGGLLDHEIRRLTLEP